MVEPAANAANKRITHVALFNLRTIVAPLHNWPLQQGPRIGLQRFGASQNGLRWSHRSKLRGLLPRTQTSGSSGADLSFPVVAHPLPLTRCPLDSSAAIGAVAWIYQRAWDRQQVRVGRYQAI